MNATLKTALSAGAVALALGGACDPGAIPNRNVSDVTHEVRALTDTTRQLVVDNPNAVRVGSEFHIRVFAEGVREPVADYVEHLYIPPNMESTLDIDVSTWCGGTAQGSGAEALPACADLRADAVLLQTYWMADE